MDTTMSEFKLDSKNIRGIPERPIDQLFNRLCGFKVDSFSVRTIVNFRRESRFLTYRKFATYALKNAES